MIRTVAAIAAAAAVTTLTSGTIAYAGGSGASAPAAVTSKQSSPLRTQTGSVTPAPKKTTAPAPKSPQAAALKPRVAGLVITDPGKLGTYGGAVHNALAKGLTWATLEPTQGHYNFAPLHKVLDRLPKGAYVKVVVDSGTHAPSWVKAWGAVDVTLTRAGSHGTVPYFWTPKYIAAYNAFQSAMAAEFDADPRLKQVVYTGVMTENSEPFTLGGDSASAQRLYAAGFSWAGEKAALSQTLTHMLGVWTHTRVELALHGAWQYATASGVARGSWTDVKNFVDPFVTKYGSHLITANYGLGPNDGPPDAMYTYMAARGADSGYQLTVGSPYNADTRAASVRNGIKMGGSYVEHAAFSAGSGMTLQQQDAALAANAAR